MATKKRGRPVGYKTDDKTRLKIAISKAKDSAEKRGLPVTRGKKVEKSASKFRDLDGCILCLRGGLTRRGQRFSVKAVLVDEKDVPWAETQLNYITVCETHKNRLSRSKGKIRNRFTILALRYLRHIYKPYLSESISPVWKMSKETLLLLRQWDKYAENFISDHPVERDFMDSIIDKMSERNYIDFWNDVQFQTMLSYASLQTDIRLDEEDVDEQE